MAKWNHEIEEQVQAVEEVGRSLAKAFLEAQQSLLNLQDSLIVVLKPRMEAFIASLDPQ